MIYAVSYNVEVRLDAYEIDVDVFARLIKKHAAEHQSGVSLKHAKEGVDKIIQDMKDSLGKDKDYQVVKWTELLNKLESFQSSTADPLWRTVINHARFRIKSRRSTLIHGRGRFNPKA